MRTRALPALIATLLLVSIAALPACVAQDSSSTGDFSSSTGDGDGNTPSLLPGDGSSGVAGNSSTNSTVDASTASFVPEPEPPSFSSTGSSSIPPVPGVIGRGDSSFGSTEAIFLTTVRDVWIAIILWTMVFTAFGFFGASVYAVRVSSSGNGGGMKHLWLWLPPLCLVVGAGVGFIQGALSAVLIAAISIAIPYPVGIDIAAGLGIGQAICIIYFHLGRADFIHR